MWKRQLNNMRKNLADELILPAFWLFFFMVYSTDDRKTSLKNSDKLELKRDDISAGIKTGTIKETTFTKAVYLTGF